MAKSPQILKSPRKAAHGKCHVQVEPTGFFIKIDTRHRAHGARSALAEGGSMPVPIPWTLRHRRNHWIGAAVAADRCHGAHTDRPPPYRDSVVKKPPRGPTAMAMGASYRGSYTRTAPAPPSFPPEQNAPRTPPPSAPAIYPNSRFPMFLECLELEIHDGNKPEFPYYTHVIHLSSR